MILAFFLFPAFFCQILKELKKYGSLKVVPGTKLYLDISTFKDGEAICFEITMDLFFAETELQERQYQFYLSQVSFTTHPDNSYWDTDLPQVTATDKEGELDETKFKYDVIKQAGSTYIYIKLPAPFTHFYTIYENKIKIKNAGGSNLNALGTVLGIIIPLIIIIAIIIYCYKKRKRNNANTIQPVPVATPQPVYVQQNVAQPIYPNYQNASVQQNLHQTNYQYINVQPNNPQLNYQQQNYAQQGTPDTNYNSRNLNQQPVPDSKYTSNQQTPISAYPNPFDAQANSKNEFMGKDNAAPNYYNQ